MLTNLLYAAYILVASVVSLQSNYTQQSIFYARSVFTDEASLMLNEHIDIDSGDAIILYEKDLEDESSNLINPFRLRANEKFLKKVPVDKNLKENSKTDSIYSGKAIIYKYDSDVNSLTRFPIGKKLFLSTAFGVYSTEVIGHLLYSYSIYPILKNNFNFHINKEEWSSKERVYFASEKSNVSKIFFYGTNNKSIINKFYRKLKKKLEKLKPDKDIYYKPIKYFNVFPGFYTSKNKIQYLVTFFYNMGEDNYSYGSYVANHRGKPIKIIQESKFHQDYFCWARAVVDADGDGLYEVVFLNAGCCGSENELIGYKNGSFVSLKKGIYMGTH